MYVLLNIMYFEYYEVIVVLRKFFCFIILGD